MLETILLLSVGIFLGWFVLPQPEWAQTLYTKIKDKLFSSSN